MLLSKLHRGLANAYPVVDALFNSSAVAFARRLIDTNWYYRDQSGISVTGFNPFDKYLYYGGNSRLERLICGPDEDAASELDWFVYEIFLAAHDYMHTYSIQLLASELGTIDSLDALLDPSVRRDFCYFLLLSEAVATIAVDYWLLWQRPIHRVIGAPCGVEELTTAGAPKRNAALRSAVLCRSFFETLARVYCTTHVPAEWAGARAPKWVQRELQQARKQQRQVAAWLRYLTNSKTPVPGTISEKQYLKYSDLTHTICDRLWASCFTDELPTIAKWKSFGFLAERPAARSDFRFVNVRSVANLREDAMAQWRHPLQRRYFVTQYLACFDAESVADGAALVANVAESGEAIALIEDSTGCALGHALVGEPFFHLVMAN